MGESGKKSSYRGRQEEIVAGLPGCAGEYVRLVAKKMGYRRSVRGEVMAELAGHFADAMKGCASEEEREKKARELIEEFGDAGLLGVLCRRAKKRCRPMWQKVLIRSFQVLGVQVLYIVIRGATLFVGRPEVKVDYVAWLNELVRESDDESLNAMPYFEKAVQLLDKEAGKSVVDFLEWPGDMTVEEHGALAELLEANKEAMDLVVAGAHKPYSWVTYKGEAVTDVPADMGTRVTGNLMPSLGGYKSLAQLLMVRVKWRAYNGDAKGAAEDALALCRFGRHLEGKGLLVEQLVGIAIEGLAQANVLELLHRVEVPAESLLELQRELEKGGEVMNLEAEKAFLYDMIQRSFTDDGEGNGRVLASGVPLVANDLGDMVGGFVLFDYPDRQETTAMVDDYFRRLDDYMEKTPWELHTEGGEEELADLGDASLLLRILAPAHERIVEIMARAKTHRGAAAAVLALMRYKKDKGNYPEELNELVDGGYLGSAPEDLYSGKSLVYRKEGEDFILYSVWNNFQDDGGVMGTGMDGRPRQWGEGGDMVFWPVLRD